MSVAVVMMVNNSALMMKLNDRIESSEKATFNVQNESSKNVLQEFVSILRTAKQDGFACPEISEINNGSDFSQATTFQQVTASLTIKNNNNNFTPNKT